MCIRDSTYSVYVIVFINFYVWCIGYIRYILHIKNIKQQIRATLPKFKKWNIFIYTHAHTLFFLHLGLFCTFCQFIFRRWESKVWLRGRVRFATNKPYSQRLCTWHSGNAPWMHRDDERGWKAILQPPTFGYGITVDLTELTDESRVKLQYEILYCNQMICLCNKEFSNCKISIFLFILSYLCFCKWAQLF